LIPIHSPPFHNSAWASGLLDGVNLDSLGLMAAVSWQLGRASLPDPLAILIALASFVLLIRFKVNSTWSILGDALTGLPSIAFR
jgi:chromate transporter